MRQQTSGSQVEESYVSRRYKYSTVFRLTLTQLRAFCRLWFSVYVAHDVGDPAEYVPQRSRFRCGGRRVCSLTLYLMNSVRVASAVDTFPDFKYDDYGTALERFVTRSSRHPFLSLLFSLGSSYWSCCVFTRTHDVGFYACRDGRLGVVDNSTAYFTIVEHTELMDTRQHGLPPKCARRPEDPLDGFIMFAACGRTSWTY